MIINTCFNTTEPHVGLRLNEERMTLKCYMADTGLLFSHAFSDKELIEVTLEIEKSSVADAEEWLGIENIEPRGNALIANMTLPNDDVLVNKILSYGGAVKVLEPKELCDKVKAAAKKIYEAN